jgi:hypothetical protein
MSDAAIKRENRVPEWFPAWATRLSDLYFSGTTSMFVLHGDVQDLVRTGDGYGTLRSSGFCWPGWRPVKGNGHSGESEGG